MLGFALVAVAVLACAVGCAPAENAVKKPAASQSVTPAPSVTPSPSATVAEFDKTRLSIDDPNSIWIVGNKLRQLSPANYAPTDLVTVKVHYISNPLMRAEAAAALETMFAASVAEGAGELQIQNAYRSYNVQVRVHDSWVARIGQAKADAQSARPGYSEHQTGLTLDITSRPETCSIQACFGQTPQGQWLAANAYRFGYILRYPADKTPITGYIYEPWHFRYVGVELATEMHDTGVTTLEEFFGLPPAPDYAP